MAGKTESVQRRESWSGRHYYFIYIKIWELRVAAVVVVVVDDDHLGILVRGPALASSEKLDIDGVRSSSILYAFRRQRCCLPLFADYGTKGALAIVRTLTNNAMQLDTGNIMSKPTLSLYTHPPGSRIPIVSRRAVPHQPTAIRISPIRYEVLAQTYPDSQPTAYTVSCIS
jgi:hypothetical protein